MDKSHKLKTNRKFYDLSKAHVHREENLKSWSKEIADESYQLKLTESANVDGRNELMTYINDSIVGRNVEFTSPFGKRHVLCCDYTASGKPLSFIENYILHEVLPFYGNTHTTTSVTSLQTTLFRDEARDIIRNAVGASENDAVLFVGSGCTGAVNKLRYCLNFSEPPIVFVGAYEHHSNLLPWREIAAKVIRIGEAADGLLDLKQLENELNLAQQTGNMMIGCFAAASNITGILSQDMAITSLLHRYGALAFWDYATAAPYVKLSMNPTSEDYPHGIAYKDAMYFSMHKFIGGVQTPGILIAKKSLFRNPIPNVVGGGTVFFVDRENHHYLQDIEMREEGGTPAIVESIRAGLVLQLKENVTTKAIMEREEILVKRAYEAWCNVPELILLGNTTAPRLPIFSFVIRHQSGYLLHHNFVSSLLNDMYGIQTRGGCACAGPYAQDLLGIDSALAVRYENILLEDDRLDRTHLRRKEEHSPFEFLRPGFTRLNLPYFASDDEIDFILRAVVDVAKHGWTMLPQYQVNAETGEWHHHTQLSFKERKWLGYVDYSQGFMRVRHPRRQPSSEAPSSYEECLKTGKEIFSQAVQLSCTNLPDQNQSLSSEAASLRWFLLPSEAEAILKSKIGKIQVRIPFNPAQYKGRSTLPLDSCTYSTLQRDDLQAIENIAANLVNGTKQDMVDCTENSISSGSDSNEVAFDRIHSSLPEDCIAFADNYEEDSEDEFVVNTERRPKLSDLKILDCQLWKSPNRKIMKPSLEALIRYKMINDGDRVLVCVSGGKDSLTLLHAIRQYQRQSYRYGIQFEMGAVTVDPGSDAYDPSPLIPYMEQLGIPYFYEEQCIIDQAKDIMDIDSICSFCSRLKRGRIYAAARRNNYNVIALGQHLDDLAESFFMSVFHNGRLRTMKAAYSNRQNDLKIIRPFVYVREKELRQFAHDVHLPVIPENCPACFQAPKERHRIKQLLAQQELLYPRVYLNMKTALLPLMGIDQPFVERQLFGKQSFITQHKQESRKHRK